MRKSNYGIKEIVKNCFFYLKTKLFYKGARLIRSPFIVRGKKYIDFGTGLTIGYNCRFEVNGKFKKNDKRIIMGSNVNVGDNVRISCCEYINIGNNVLIGSRVLIIDNSHGCYHGDETDSPIIPPNSRNMYTAPIFIKDNVWIGDGAVIQKGVTIGSGAIIGANTVVSNDVDEGTIVGGVPARVIKRYNKEKNVWER